MFVFSVFDVRLFSVRCSFSVKENPCTEAKPEPINKKIPMRIKRLGIYLLLKHELFGRSSDFSALLATFPSRSIATVVNEYQKSSPYMQFKRGGVTAAGPYRIKTGFPFSPVGHHKASRLNFAVLIKYPPGIVNVFLSRI